MKPWAPQLLAPHANIFVLGILGLLLLGLDNVDKPGCLKLFPVLFHMALKDPHCFYLLILFLPVSAKSTSIMTTRWKYRHRKNPRG